MEIIDDKIKEIVDLCAELHEASIEIEKFNPVTHLSKVQWTGIIGAVQEYRADKRLIKMMNAPFYKEWSFYQYAFHLGKTAEKIVELILDIQKDLPKEDERYYGIVNSSLPIIMKTVNDWYNYSPDMAEAEITIGDQKNVSLGPSLKAWIKDEFAKLDLPEDLKSLQEPEKSGGGGCFSVILLLLSIGSISISALTFLFIVIL